MTRAAPAGDSGLIGIVVPHLGRWWFGEVIAGLEAVLRPAGYDMVLYPVADARARLTFFEGVAQRRRVDALAIVALPLTANEIAIVRSAGVPAGCVGVLAPGIAGVAIDDRRAARVLTKHLLTLGHTRIGLVGGDPQEPFHFTAAPERRRGYRYALHSDGLWPDDALDVPGLWTPRGGAAAARRLLSLPDPPTAIFAMSDEMAVGVLCALRQEGVRVPEDVSVAGFDDHPDAELFGLTTIAQPAHDCGARLAAMLVAELDGSLHGEATTSRAPGAAAPAHALHVVNTFTRLVVRSSTGAAPAGSGSRG